MCTAIPTYKDFIEFLNCFTRDSVNRYILKGDSALVACYGLTKEISVAEFDALNTQSSIRPVLDAFCKAYHVSYIVMEDSDFVKKYEIALNNESPLVIRVDYRKCEIPETDYAIVNNDFIGDTLVYKPFVLL